MRFMERTSAYKLQHAGLRKEGSSWWLVLIYGVTRKRHEAIRLSILTGAPT
ncbi:hypothetical protein AN958_12826 [Leucoagaricus sp. SymC.cos]|nr:hypothetical protein AN958_12826 [Leucoagaricus sp. SymC.cos]